MHAHAPPRSFSLCARFAYPCATRTHRIATPPNLSALDCRGVVGLGRWQGFVCLFVCWGKGRFVIGVLAHRHGDVYHCVTRTHGLPITHTPHDETGRASKQRPQRQRQRQQEQQEQGGACVRGSIGAGPLTRTYRPQQQQQASSTHKERRDKGGTQARPPRPFLSLNTATASRGKIPAPSKMSSFKAEHPLGA